MSRVTPFRQLNNRRVNGKTSHAITLRLLRHRARQIESREQFERIVAQAKHQAEVRRLMEPMLRPNLPCCTGPVDTTAPYPYGPMKSHTHGCPTRDGANQAPGGIGG